MDNLICFVAVEFAMKTVNAANQTFTIYLSQNDACPEGCFRVFRTDQSISYDNFCDDFGPMNMLCVFNFIRAVDDQIEICVRAGCDQLVYAAREGNRSFTNAAFLLGAYMILKLNQCPRDVARRFQHLSPLLFEGYRDATFSHPDFRLRLIDCWEGLHRGKSMGWVATPTSSLNSEWGQINKEEYAHYDNPLNGDLHEVVPYKFVAFRGPKDLGAVSYRNNYKNLSRDFDPKYYLDIFEGLNVSTVIRLNEPSYSGQVFTDQGIEHHDLHFDDCTPPPPHIVKSFLRIVKEAKGLVAVHCKAGLGRTGTLIALYMMSTYGFSARGAMGWLRIMRPGSVIGQQQHFLCSVDSGMCTRAAEGRLPSSPAASEAWALRARTADRYTAPSGRAASPHQAALLAKQLATGMGRRDRTRAGRPASSPLAIEPPSTCLREADDDAGTQPRYREQTTR